MNDEDRTLAKRAEELRQETAALNALLSGYASKAEVERQLADERRQTKKLIGQRTRNRNIALIVLALAVAITALFVWRVTNLADDNHANSCMFVTKHNLLVEKVEDAARLVSVPTPGRDPNVQATLDKFVSDYVATVEPARVPRDDC